MGYYSRWYLERLVVVVVSVYARFHMKSCIMTSSWVIKSACVTVPSRAFDPKGAFLPQKENRPIVSFLVS